MKVIYHGFDGLEFALKFTIPDGLATTLAEAKDQAMSTYEICAVRLGKEALFVHSSGAVGGYAYHCKHRDTGDWFFKKPTTNDKWGVRFSAASHAIALLGINGLRERCSELLSVLGIKASEKDYTPSRVDFAMDFVLPEFAPSPDQFVTHARTGRKAIAEVDQIETNGCGTRVTSVTIGKMPGRQVIIYDKSKEVIEKRKPEWPAIWRKSLGEDADILTNARVWRIELRVAKRHLKDVWHVDDWHGFYHLLEKILLKLMEDLRYCEIGMDSNRSRWKPHLVWQRLADVVRDDLFDHIPTLTVSEYTEIKREQKIDELHKQALGLLTSTAAINSVKPDDFGDYLQRVSKSLSDTAQRGPIPLQDKLAKAAERYAHLR